MDNPPCVLICWCVSYWKRSTSIRCNLWCISCWNIQGNKISAMGNLCLKLCVYLFLAGRTWCISSWIATFLELPIETYLLWSICVSFVVDLLGIKEGPDRSEGLCCLFGEIFAWNPKCFRQATKTRKYPKWGGTEWHDHEFLYPNLIRRTYDIHLTTKQTYCTPLQL